MVATESNSVEKIVRLLGENGFNVSVKSIKEKSLLNSVKEFELVRGVSRDMSLILSIRISKDFRSRIHVYYSRKNEDVAEQLEVLGFTVTIDDRGLTASALASIDDVYRIVERLVNILK